jgi:hypothetical protein
MSYGAWGEHQAAAAAATAAVAQIQEVCAMGTERCDQAVGTILNAVGSTEMESARNAMSMIQHAKYLFDEAYGACNNAVAELERYRGGF